MLFDLALVLPVLLIAYACLVLALRCLGYDRLELFGRGFAAAKKLPELEGESFTPSMGLKTAAWALGALCAVYGAGAVFCRLADVEFARAWLRSDAVHYLRLAQLGYHGYVEDGQHLFLVFFPLYPWLTGALDKLVGNTQLSGQLLSCLAYTAGCLIFARLVTEDFGWKTAKRSLMLLSAYPFAFFFAGLYTESLFFCLSVGCFYLIRRHRWLAAGALGALAALTRMQGAFLCVAGFAEYCMAERPLDKLRAGDWPGLGRDLLKKLLPLAVMFLGVGAYLALNYAVEGDPFRFAFYQREHWYQYFVPLPKCLDTIWSGILSYSRRQVVLTTWLPDLIVFLLCLAGLLYAVRRLPTAWGGYLLMCLTLNFSLSWPLSCGRYIACAFPLPAALAIALRKKPAAVWSLAAVFAGLQGLFLWAFLTGKPVY